MESSDSAESSYSISPGISVTTEASGGNANGAPTAYLYHHAQKAVLWAMLVNVIIAALKLGIALTVSRSAALFSEGLHSLADSVNSVTLLFGLIQGKKSPDRTHPFGYGLETNFWALFASFFMLLSAFWSVFKGIERLTHPADIENVAWAIIILSVSLVLEIFAIHTASRAVLEEVGQPTANVFMVIPKAFQHIRQVIGPTTRFVFYEDTLAFLGAFLALIAIVGGEISVQMGWLSASSAHIPDAVASILIGIVLLTLAFTLFLHNRGFLTGAAASENVEKKILELTNNIHGVSEVIDLKTIDQGHSGLIVHMSVEVEPETQVKDVDDLTEHIKEKLQQRIPSVRQVFIEVLADESETDWSEKFQKLIQEGQDTGVLKPREVLMLKKMYDFTESVAREVMVPRTDVEYVDIETPLSDVADLIVETGHSRLPVYKEYVDNMVGVIHARDVFDCIRKGTMDLPLSDLLLELEVYPENKPVSDLLEEFKRKKIHVAAIADEHGGFSGLVTIEDLLEEIVGDLWDEHEVEESMLIVESPNTILVNGKYEIYELNEQFELNIPTDEFTTIGGFVFGKLGREPEQNDVITFENLSFTVIAAEGARVITLAIHSDVPFNKAQLASAESSGFGETLPAPSGLSEPLFPTDSALPSSKPFS